MDEIDVVRVRDFLGRIADAQRQLSALGQMSETEFLGDLEAFREQIARWVGPQIGA